MPGTNHETESAFMNALPLLLRDASVDALHNYRLRQLINMKTSGPASFLRKTFPEITHAQWLEIIDAVILTKVSYFQADITFPVKFIDKLIEITVYAFQNTSQEEEVNIRSIYQTALKEYPFFANWIKKTLEVRQKKLKLLQQLAQKQANQ